MLAVLPECERSVVELPEPLASVVDYLGEDLDEREFVPTAELVEALEVEPTMFARQMAELGCRPTPEPCAGRGRDGAAGTRLRHGRATDSS